MPDDATLIVHSRLGDRFTLVGHYPDLAAANLDPANSVICPHCATQQPTSKPGESACVRCGSRLLIDEHFKAELGSNPERPWLLSLPGIAGLLIFSQVYSNEIGFSSSLAVVFGVPAILMLRQGVLYGRGGKLTALQAPVLYVVAVTITSVFTLTGLLLLIHALFSKA